MAALACNALTTPENVRAFMNIPAEHDAVLFLMINQASAYIENTQLDRRLARNTYTEFQQASGNQEFVTRQYPIVSVEYIKLAGQLIGPELYSIADDGESGIIYKDDGWTYEGYPHGLAGDSIAAKRNIEIRYTAGYILPKDGSSRKPATLPADIEGMCIEMILAQYGKLTSGGNAGIKSFAISDVRWEWTSETPQSWRDTVRRYRRFWL